MQSRRRHADGGASWCRVAALLLTLCLMNESGSAIPFEEFVGHPFNENNGYSVFPRVADQARGLPIPVPFPYFGRTFSYANIDDSGHISLLDVGRSDVGKLPLLTPHQPRDFPLNASSTILSGIDWGAVVAPYWYDVDTRGIGSGRIYYKNVTRGSDPDLTEVIDSLATRHLCGFTTTWALIVTWDHVGYYSERSDKLNTFQLVLATDGPRALAVFNYAEDGINRAGGAVAGYNVGDGEGYFQLPGSFREDIQHIDNTTGNTGKEGQWLLVLDGAYGKEFYVAFFSGVKLSTFYLYVTTAERRPVAFTVSAPGTGYSANGTAQYGEVATFAFDASEYALMSTTDRGKGIIVRTESEGELSVYAGNLRVDTSDSFLSLPKLPHQSQSMYKYIAASYGEYDSSTVAIIAQYSDTQLSVTPNVDTTIDTTFIPAGATMTVALQEAETLLIASTSDLTGLLVASNKPLAVLSGHTCTNVPTSVAYCDLLVQQVPPVSTWGRQFATAPLKGRQAYDVFRVVASEDPTEVMVTCSSSSATNPERVANMYQLNERDFAEFNVSSTLFCFIQGSSNILVLQYSAGFHADSTTGDPTMITVPALTQYCNHYSMPTIGPSDGSINFTHQMNIFIPTPFYQLDQIFLNNQPLSSYHLNFAVIEQDGAPRVYAAQVDLTEGVHTLYHTGPAATLGVVMYGFAPDTSYGHPGGLRLTQDINECAVAESPCHANASCTNTPGSFTCACNTGYSGDGMTCSDIDECVTQSPCHASASCTNTLGSFTCACNPGYSGDGLTCSDIDECLTQSPCHASASCTNTLGSFTCACNTGYRGDGVACYDIDECVTESPCHVQASCTNTLGSFTCACNAGYRGDGVLCSDINECVAHSPCHVQASCTNTLGSFTCACNTGYSGDGMTCSDIDECVTQSLCHGNASCTNTLGSFTCACDTGYSGDGMTCSDVDECLTESPCHASASCTNTLGSFTCACNPGYSGDGLACTDINECVTQSPCHGNASCTNTLGSFTCACNTGYSGDGMTCNDMDECATESPCHASNALCTNTPGSFTCACNAGYVGDGMTCYDIDECIDQSPCDPNASCTNTLGSFTCACNPGYSGDGRTCSDINECLTQSPCHTNASCTNTLGSFACACNTGYAGNGLLCYDIDECVTQSPCHGSASCTNTLGSSTCACNPGYSGDGTTCSDVDECLTQSPCDLNASCTNTLGSFTCACNMGYAGGGLTCYDIDECNTQSPCHASALCTNTLGSFTCACNPGYSGNGVTCSDVDECVDHSPCHANASCTNTLGSFTCACNTGYSGDGMTCYDDDECTTRSPCHASASCTNTLGSFACACNTGYSGDGATCNDVNECMTQSPCHGNASCTNTLGSFACACNTGYAGNGLLCYDIDECIVQPPCDSNASCTNTLGSVRCECNTGYSGDGRTCYDIDECVTLSPCDPNASCTNTLGSFTCACNTGYSGDGLTCSDIDECVTQSPCDPYALCTNTPGSYTCACNPGFNGNGTTCDDINECLTQSPCHASASCTNTLGSFTCACNTGYRGDGVTCYDVDECLTESPCHVQASCTNTLGSFTCACNTGYRGDGVACYDINECVAHSPCHASASCTNTPGSFTCACNTGYSGDGVACNDINECLTESPCHVQAFCTNTLGSFTCACNTGYTGDGTACYDIDECLAWSPCHGNASCTNTLGSFTCACNPGYSGDGVMTCYESLTPPTQLTVLEVTQTSFSVSWMPPLGDFWDASSLYYLVNVTDTEGDSVVLLQHTVNDTTLQLRVTNLLPGRLHQVSVAAVAGENIGPSDYAFVMTRPASVVAEITTTLPLVYVAVGGIIALLLLVMVAALIPGICVRLCIKHKKRRAYSYNDVDTVASRNTVHAGWIQQNPVYTSPHLTREEPDNPADADVHPARAENIYSLEPHQGTADNDREVARTGWLQNPLYADVHFRREERHNPADADVPVAREEQPEPANTDVHFTRAENIYSVEPHQVVEAGCVQENQAYTDEQLTREEQPEPVYTEVCFTRAENITSVEPHQDPPDYEFVDTGSVQENRTYTDEQPTREEPEPAFTGVHFTRAENIYSVEPHQGSADYELVEAGCVQENRAYTDEQLTREEQPEPAYTNVHFTRAENIYSIEPHQDSADYELVEVGCVQENRTYTDEQLTREEQPEPAYTSVHFTRSENVYSVEPHQDPPDYEYVDTGSVQENLAYTDEQPTREEPEPAFTGVHLTRAENVYSMEPHQDSADYELVEAGCVQENRAYTDEQPTREEQPEPAYTNVHFTRAENIYSIEPHQDSADYELVEVGCGQENRAYTNEKLTMEEKPAYTDL